MFVFILSADGNDEEERLKCVIGGEGDGLQDGVVVVVVVVCLCLCSTESKGLSNERMCLQGMEVEREREGEKRVHCAVAQRPRARSSGTKRFIEGSSKWPGEQDGGRRVKKALFP